MSKRLLVDGSNLARIHFAANPALDNNGNPSGIIKGFINAMQRVNRLYAPQEVVVFFDGPGGSCQRRAIYKGYKAGRKSRVVVGQQYQFDSPEAAEKNYDWQVSIVSRFLGYCGVNIITTDKYETDDGIAYVIKSNPDDAHMILSCDKDFFQLISDKVKIYNPIMKRILDKEYISEKYDIHPNNWLFFRSINGDASDNIKGVKGFGPATLKKLFYLESEREIELGVISEGLSLLREAPKLDAKEKRTKKRLESLEKDLVVLERNWRLMNLREPLMALSHKEKVDYQLDSFVPVLSTKLFYEITRLGLGVNPLTPNEFVRLRKV